MLQESLVDLEDDASSGPMAQSPPPEKAVVDMATTLSLDLLRPLLVEVDPLDEELVPPLFVVDVEEYEEDELDDLGSVEANLNIISHSSSHSFSVRISPYCRFCICDCHLHRL